MKNIKTIIISISLIISLNQAHASGLIILNQEDSSQSVMQKNNSDIQSKLSMTPITSSKDNIDASLSMTPIVEKPKNDTLKDKNQLLKLQNNSASFFSDLKKDMNSPTVDIDGKTYQKNQIVSVNGGRIILTPIENNIKKTTIPLPAGLQNISSDVKWVNYDDYIKQQKLADQNKPKDKPISRPEGYYQNGKKSDYVDDFFDRKVSSIDTTNDEKIKKGLNSIFDEYKGDKSETIKPVLVKNDQQARKELNLDNSYKNIVDLYTNPNRKETLGYINNDRDVVNSTPSALRSHTIPDYLMGKQVYIRIFKSTNSLELYLLDHGKYKLANIYNICTFSGGLGPKKFAGDSKSPEGFYSFNKNSFNPNSEYDKSMNLGFPNQYDREHGYTGSLLMVHGGCKSIGCYAMTDKYIQEIYAFAQAAIKNGQSDIQVDIFPFKMTDSNMNKYKNNENYQFWLNIKKGYDIFEKTGRPPNISVRNKEYIIT